MRMKYFYDNLDYLAFAGLVVLSVAGAYVLSRYNCASYEDKTGRMTSYYMGTCYVQVGGQWYRKGELSYSVQQQSK